MSDQYDLAMAKMSAAMQLVMTAYGGSRPAPNPEANLRLLMELFDAAFERITDTVSPTLTQEVIPGPPDTSTI